MFVTLLQRRTPFTIVLNSCFRLTRLSCSDSALVKHPKIKAVVEQDLSRFQRQEFTEFFIEKILLNRFQANVLEYPEIDCFAEFNALKHQVDLAKDLITGETESEVPLLEADDKKAIATLKKHEFIGFKIPISKNGYGYLLSEYTLMQEVLAVDPALSKTISEQEDYGIYLIDNFGSELQKDKYLAKLISGEKIVSFANIEKETLVSLLPNSLSTSAELSSDTQSYRISGTKCWVYNANLADLFIVSANIKSDGEESSKTTLFLIDKDTPGIKIHEPIDKIGIKNLSICDVTFDNVVVPISSILGNVGEGEQMIRKALSQGKLSSGGSCLAAMRKLINRAIKHCVYNEFFKKDKTETEYFKRIIASMCSKLYVAESMTYFLTGRVDNHTDPDVFLESLIVKIYTSETLQFIVKNTMGILGPEFFSDENQDLVDISKDSQFYIACDDANDYLRLFLSSAGMKYVINYRKNRSLWQWLLDFINDERTRIFATTPEHISWKGEAKGYLHLMFSAESCLMEDSIMIVSQSARYLMHTYKDKLFERHSELKILSEMIIGIYAMAATLARASRAYCVGVKFQEYDRICTEYEIRHHFDRVREWRFDIRRPEELTSKYSEISSYLTSDISYSDLFPVKRNLTIQKEKSISNKS